MTPFAPWMDVTSSVDGTTIIIAFYCVNVLILNHTACLLCFLCCSIRVELARGGSRRDDGGRGRDGGRDGGSRDRDGGRGRGDRGFERNGALVDLSGLLCVAIGFI